jgi:predicted aminopeptidase
VNNSSNPARIRAALILALASFVTGGCYILESARGQLALMSKRQPIARVLENPATPPAVRAKLEAARSIRDFASGQLGLPDNGSYRSYADVGRPYVVWSVVAAPEFSTEAKEWCYPIVGCVAYRGYFALRRARSFAGKLRAQGYDVSVGGVAAYSTLGHFDDPILNTMMSWDDIELAAIVFHELTHQEVYVPGDSAFNEALATTVEEEGVRRWLLAQGRDADLAAYRDLQEHYLVVIDLLRGSRTELNRVYASGIGVDLMRERKRQTFVTMRDAYSLLRAQWRGHAPFETWFDGEINNAHLASVATYYDCVPGFKRQLALAGGDLKVFFRRVRELAKSEQAARDAVVCGNS